ncbi:hemolysin family protein [Caldibacillus lycopersici]|uniref:Hemolysin family protein n=1 Tax=Perspicuibacillus lycopersici TaxID=1325689 RepID=A0AAE3LP52_9BACI|nr:hemolysin family protein [Perspicuibacillus lycopersici]MCU9614636.1 hemolysin family protein [Perspicuibacillus lycopersici]
MADVPIGLIILLVVLIILSAFFSSAETAFSSVNRVRLRNYASENKPGSKKALSISNNFDNAISTILVGNNLVNISASSIATAIATNIFGASTGLIISTFGMTLIILTFGEILPKSMAKENAEVYALKISGILFLLIKCLTPINFFFTKLKDLVSKMYKNKEAVPSVTEDEIKVMVDISEEEGVINKNEKELIHRSLEFNEIIVSEILTHRLDIVAIEVNTPVEEVKQLLLEERYSRIPVYEDNIDNIIGFLSEREFFAEIMKNNEVNIRDILRQPIFVVKSMKIASILPELQRTKSHMAIVNDEFGGTAGLITMEDILEELVGEIWDEHDEKVFLMKKLDENTYEFDAQIHIEDFAEVLQITDPESSYYNVGGWIFEKLARVPKQGEIIQFDHLKITILEVDNNRLQRVKVEKQAMENSETEQVDD